jgi:hypothetical protein
VVDGEIVAVDAEGRPSCQAHQHRSTRPHHAIVFCAFDLLHLNGQDITPLPLLRAMRPAIVMLARPRANNLALRLPPERSRDKGAGFWSPDGGVL